MRAELDLQVLVLVVEEKSLHHLIVPQSKVCLAREAARRRRVVIEGGGHWEPHLLRPRHGGEGDVGRPVLQPLAVPGEADGEGLPGWSIEMRVLPVWVLLTIICCSVHTGVVRNCSWQLGQQTHCSSYRPQHVIVSNSAGDDLFVLKSVVSSLLSEVCKDHVISTRKYPWQSGMTCFLHQILRTWSKTSNQPIITEGNLVLKSIFLSISINTFWSPVLVAWRLVTWDQRSF